MGRDHKASHLVHMATYLFRSLHPWQIAIDPKGKNVAHVGLRFHGSYQHKVALAGESFEIMSVPRTTVFSEAEAL